MTTAALYRRIAALLLLAGLHVGIQGIRAEEAKPTAATEATAEVSPEFVAQI